MTTRSFQHNADTVQDRPLKQLGAVAVIIALLGIGACQPKVAQDAQVIGAATKPSSARLEVALPPPKSRADNAPATVAPIATELDSQGQSAAGGSASSIAGGWVNAGGACDSGAAVMFNSDGTYLSEGEKGTWAMSGKTLTVTTTSFADSEPVADARQGPDESTGDSGEKSVLTVLSINEEAARVVLSNGSNANWTRCNG